MAEHETPEEAALLVKRIWDRILEKPGILSWNMAKEFPDVPAHRVHTKVRMLKLRGQIVQASEGLGLHAATPETQKLDSQWDSPRSRSWRRKLQHCWLRTDGAVPDGKQSS